MIKIEIFNTTGKGNLQAEINHWLKKNPDIIVHQVMQSESEGEEGWAVTISFLYSEQIAT